MKFMHDGKIIELKVDTDTNLHLVTPPQLRRMVQTDNASSHSSNWPRASFNQNWYTLIPRNWVLDLQILIPILNTNNSTTFTHY